MVEISIHIYMPSSNINTVPINVNLYSQQILQPRRYQHTPSGNCNTESHYNKHIHPVAISEQLLVWGQLIQAKTVDMVTLIVFPQKSKL